jgi:hypothetical protein
MGYQQFTGDELLGFYGTNQIQKCTPFKLPLPEQLVGLVPTNPEDPNACVQDPCYTLCVFGEDNNAFLYDYPIVSGNADFELQKFDGTIWNVVANPMGANEGTLYDIGSFPDYPSYAGFEIDWSLVESNYGLGVYRFVVKTDDPTNNLYSLPFDLKEDSCNNKEATVKIEMTNQGRYFNFNYTRENLRLREYDLINLEWNDSVRYFGVLVKSDVESEDVNLNYADSHDLPVFTEDRDTYEIKIPQISQELLQRLYSYGLRSQAITLTDYNTKNQKFYNKLPIVANGNYSFERRPTLQLVDSVSIPIKHEFVRRYKKT